jgi:uncharacterized glyoxalase superfamily protein PhnB
MLDKNNIFYPIVYTENQKDTVTFLESFFDFSIAYQDDSIIVLENKNDQKNYLGIACPSQSLLDAHIRPENAVGSVLNIYVSNIDLAYQELHWNGATIVQDIKTARCGRKFMAVKDPNGIIFLVTHTGKEAKYRAEKELACA